LFYFFLIRRNKGGLVRLYARDTLVQERTLKKKITTFVAFHLLIAAVVPALAQTVGVSVNVAPEERTVIKEYVVKEKVPTVTMKEVRIGTKVPADVELRAVPSQWGAPYAMYRYVYSGDNVYLVDPSSREVVTIVD